MSARSESMWFVKCILGLSILNICLAGDVPSLVALPDAELVTTEEPLVLLALRDIGFAAVTYVPRKETLLEGWTLHVGRPEGERIASPEDTKKKIICELQVCLGKEFVTPELAGLLETYKELMSADMLRDLEKKKEVVPSLFIPRAQGTVYFLAFQKDAYKVQLVGEMGSFVSVFVRGPIEGRPMTDVCAALGLDLELEQMRDCPNRFSKGMFDQFLEAGGYRLRTGKRKEFYGLRIDVDLYKAKREDEAHKQTHDRANKEEKSQGYTGVQKEGKEPGAAAGQAKNRQSFGRPEEVGEDFSGYDSAGMLDALRSSQDKVARRKAARVLGDRHMNGELADWSEDQQRAVDEVVAALLKDTANRDDDAAREEANHQVGRLWRLCVPTLLGEVGKPYARTAENAGEFLSLMRNEEIVKALVGRAKAAETEQQKKWYIFILSDFMKQRTSVIEGRSCTGNEESVRLVQTHILPWLDELRRNDESEAVRKDAERAYEKLRKLIENPPKEMRSAPRL